VILIPLRACFGEPDESIAFCLELAVDAEETGSRGRELRKGGDVFSGGAEINAFRLGFFAGFSEPIALPLGDWCVGVAVWLVGVVERPAGLHGLCSPLRGLPFERDLVVYGELERVDVGLDVSEGMLDFLEAKGNRDEGFVLSGWEEVGDFWG